MRKSPVTVLAITLLASQADAFTPESGFWWNPAESGRGYSLEIQDDYLFLAAYVYDNTGTPVWFTAQGTVQVTDNSNDFAVYTGVLTRSINGQCTGSASACPPRLPTNQIGAGGNFRIDFSSETRATLTWAGGTTPIQRFDYALTPANGDPRTDAMLGQWQLVLDYSGVVSGNNYPLYGDILIFDRRSQDSNEKYFDGCRTLVSSTRACSTSMVSNNGASGFHFTETQSGATKDRLLIAVRDDAQEFLIYYLDYGTYQVNGLVKTCPASIPASQRFSQCIRSNNYTANPVRGLRTMSRSYVAGNNGAPSNAPSDLGKALAPQNTGPGLPGVSANDGGLSNAQAKTELGLDLDQIPEAAFTELMERMDRQSRD